MADAAAASYTSRRSLTQHLNKRKSDDELLVQIHRYLFKVPGAKLHRKAHIRAFYGFDSSILPAESGAAAAGAGAAAAAADIDGAGESEESVKIKERLDKWKTEELKDFCTVLGLERSGAKVRGRDTRAMVDGTFDYADAAVGFARMRDAG